MADIIKIETEGTRLKKKNNIVIIAVFALLVLTIIIIIFKNSSGTQNSGLIQDVVYPKAYDFDDYDTRRTVWEQNPVDDSFISALNNFSYNTGAYILTNRDKNINYSPLSLYYALSVASSGASSDTQAQLLALLGVSDVETLAKQCGNLYRTIYKENKIGKLKIANSIWLDNDMSGERISFKNDFVKHAAKDFYASSYSVDFSRAETGKAMAKWISTNTNGTLTPEIKTDSDQILSILNTVYFYDQWINRFDKNKTAEDVFYLSNGSKVKVDFMNKTFSSAGFSKGNGFTRAGLGLKNGGQMVFILPDDGVSLYDLLSSPQQMQETFEGGDGFSGEVVWKIPKFSFGSNLLLNDVLKRLGVSSAFTPDADFSGITNHMAYITGIQQETHISIDEDGIEASAFTQIAYSGAAMPDGRAEMILNRPFIYYITESNGNLLFIGVCENPAEK